MFKRRIYSLFTIIFLAALNACSEGNKEKNKNTETPVAVTLSAVSSGTQPAILASGEVEAVQTVNISTRVMGRITHIYVKTGDRVKKGQLLARVWDEDLKAERAQTNIVVTQADLDYVIAQTDYDRFNNLYKQQSATAKELDNVTQQYNAAKARVAAAKQTRSEANAILSYTSITAPFAGVVTQKLAEEGSMVTPGMPLLTIEQDGILQVSATIAESDISHIHLGDMANILVKSTGKNFEGKIIQVNPSSQFTGGQYVVKISIPVIVSKESYAGMFASVSIPVKNRQQEKNDLALVPLSAIINRDELTGIYTISADNSALLRWIRLGKTYGDKVEVISGLSKDEKFIHSAAGKLYNGAPVVIKNNL